MRTLEYKHENTAVQFYFNRIILPEKPQHAEIHAHIPTLTYTYAPQHTYREIIKSPL